MQPLPEKKPEKAHRIPEQSVFYGRIIPIVFVLLGVVMLLLILFAIGVLTGLIAWV
ncbi:MAG: hypothetical protein KC547_06630 [Anaerolineae bacterium]|nr:hypothetical protein [Anaerolineae bacterium]